MEIIISVLLGAWISVAGVLCLLSYKKDFKNMPSENNREEQEK